MIVSRAIKPRTFVQSRYVHDERIALPAAHGLAHPRICGSRTGVLQVNVPKRGIILVDNRDPLVTLNNLEGIGQVRGARHPGQITLDLRIGRQAVLEVLLPLPQRRLKIWDRTALHHTEASRLCADRTECDDQSRTRCVSLQIPIRGAHGLPDSVQIWFAVCRLRFGEPCTSVPVRQSGLQPERRSPQQRLRPSSQRNFSSRLSPAFPFR